MVETAEHLSDHVFPRLPVRQWVLSVPKRLRYFVQRDGKAALYIGAVAFIHRFGSSQNEDVHFHVCAFDGVFEQMTSGDDQPSSSEVIFHAASAIDEPTLIWHLCQI